MGKLILFKVALAAVMLFPMSCLLHGSGLEAKVVKGQVTSATDGEALIGATVKLEESTAATVTDLDGNFQINAEDGQHIVVSYIGYVTKTVTVRGNFLAIKLDDEASTLEDVVVIGYGVQKKKLVTGATTQLKGEDIAKLNTNNALQAMQGQTPGVNIISESGQPGSDMKVIIRGQGSNTSNSPLYIIDGIPGDLKNINPSDIESIDVLKDAASAAIYGAQAANGVVLVTTRTGKAGKAQVTFDGYIGWQTASRKIEMCDAREYMTLMEEQNINSGSGPMDWSAYPSIYNQLTGELNNTDWMGAMFKDNAPQQSYTIGVNGGSETATYAVSLGYYSQEGIVGGKRASNYDRYNFRTNLEQKLFNGLLRIGENVSMAYVRNNGIGTGNMYNNVLRPAYATSPLQAMYVSQQPARDDLNNGFSYSVASDWSQYDGNPVANLYRSKNISDSQNWVANVFAELTPIKGLKIRTQLGFNHNSSSYRSFLPSYTSTTTDARSNNVAQNMEKSWTLTWTNTATYDWTMGDHSFNAMLGMEAERYQGDRMEGSNSLLEIYEDWEHAYLDNAVNMNTGRLSGRPLDDYRRVSYFGRIGWNYKETYLFNATLRADGSSRFAKGNRFGYFPSFSAGWVITNEKFMQGIAKYMDYFKLRASWGQVGNNSIGNFLYTSPITLIDGDYNFGTGKGPAANTTGAYPNRIGNEDLKWETSEQTDIGFDARFINGHLNVNFDAYWKSTKDWIVQAPIIGTAGADAPYINGGDVKNTGVELGMTWSDKIGKVQYNIGGNFAYNKNEVGKINTADGMIHGSTNVMFNNQSEFYRISEGHAMGYFWGFKTDGLFQNQQEIDEWVAAGNGILSGAQPGDIKVIDLNHDGKLDDADKVDLGNGIPKFNFGFNLGLTWKELDFSMVWSGAAGFKVANGGYRNWGSSSQSNYTTYFLGRWTGEGTSNSIPRLVSSDISWTNFSDIYLQDGDYIRLANVTIGYDFAKLIGLKAISQARLYFQVQNLFTFTKYNGMDPEVGFGQDAWVSGIDTGVYPHARTYLVGVNLKF